MKNTYLTAFNKREVQSKTLLGGGKLIGLAGPDINTYTDIALESGFSDITIYENNKDIFLRQLSVLPKGIKLMYMDIRNHLGENAFYDLDFCCSVLGIKGQILERIIKIPRFCLTLSIRPVGLQTTIDEVNKYIKLPYYKYCDTSPMITFFKH